MAEPTTVRTSSTRAYQRWVAARQVVEKAATVYGGQHTKANKLAFRQAQAEEKRALKEYSQSRLIKFAHVLRTQS